MGKLNFKRNRDSLKLSDQFGMSAELFEETAKLWQTVQKEINDKIQEAFKPHSDNAVEYDASLSMEIFFKYFDTEEKQQVALIQFLMRDLGERAENAAHQYAKEKMMNMLKNMSNGVEGENEDGTKDIDFDELL